MTDRPFWSPAVAPLAVRRLGGAPPRFLFHATTGKKAKLYRQSGQIRGPVRGFDTLIGAMAWALKVGRKVIYRVECVTPASLLPDHHNDFGRAWWTDAVPIANVECCYSAEGAWPDGSALGGAAGFDGGQHALPGQPQLARDGRNGAGVGPRPDAVAEPQDGPGAHAGFLAPLGEPLGFKNGLQQVVQGFSLGHGPDGSAARSKKRDPIDAGHARR